MDLLRILDAKPEPCIVESDHFQIDPNYQASNIYKIATPMSDFQKELIDQIVSLHYSDILRFFEKLDSSSWENMSNNRKEIIISSLQTLLKNTQLVCFHPYLLINHFFPKSLTTRDLPHRLAETSGKFQILNDILIQLDSIYNPIDKSDKSKKEKIDIAIIAKSGKGLDLIDAMCIGNRCTLKKYSGIKLRDSQANQKKNLNLNINIHLFPSDFENLNQKEISTSLKNFKVKMKFIIFFDLSVDLNNPTLSKLIDPEVTKCFRLVPIYSVEHIQLYYEEKTSSRNVNDFLRPITAAIVILRDRVGQLPSILKPAYNKNLLFLKNYLSDPINVKWPLPDIPRIGNYTFKDVEKSLLTEVKFNFDNEEILKEEEGNRSSFQESLNTNFGGKTQMIGHIIQPRFTKRNLKSKNYYNTKRLEKNYLMNPLNKDYENLTGISKEVEQHDVLTHTLIYHFDTSIQKLININEEIKGFNEFNNIRLHNFQTMVNAYAKLENDFENNNETLNSTNKEIDDLIGKNDGLKLEIKENNEQIEKLSTSEDISEIKKNDIIEDIKVYKLLEEITKLEQKLDSINNEKKYMKEETERAKKSITESESILEKKNLINEELNNKINLIKKDNLEIVEEKKKLDETIEQMHELENINDQVRLDIENTLVSLNEIGHRSRHVNRNVLSKKHL